MQLMTVFELATKSEDELKVIFGRVSAKASRTVDDDGQTSTARASLESIARALRFKRRLNR